MSESLLRRITVSHVVVAGLFLALGIDIGLRLGARGAAPPAASSSSIPTTSPEPRPARAPDRAREPTRQPIPEPAEDAKQHDPDGPSAPPREVAGAPPLQGKAAELMRSAEQAAATG